MFLIQLFSYTVSWRYKRDYLCASIDILFYIMSYITNTMKKHYILLYHVPTYDIHKKGPDLNLPPLPAHDL